MNNEKKTGKKPALNKKYLKIGSFSITMTAVVIAVVIAVNLFVGELPATLTKIDMSSRELYTIGAETQAVAGNVDEDVVFYLIAQRGAEDSTILELLGRYEALNSRIKVKTVDPITNPTFIEQYTDESLSQNSVVVVSQRRSYAVDYYEIYTTQYTDEEIMYYYYYGQMPTGTKYFNGELALTTALDYVTRDDLPKAYFLTGHGETALNDAYAGYISTENIEKADLSILTLEAVPSDATAVVIIDPTGDISSDEAEKLITYLDEGGNIILITGALHYNSATMPNLTSLALHMGLESLDGLVMETDQNHYTMAQHYLVPSLRTDSEPLSMLTSNKYALMNAAHGIVSNGTKDVNPMLYTSNGAYVKADLNAEDLSKSDTDIQGTILVGASVVSDANGRRNSESKFVWFSSPAIVDSGADSWVSGGNSAVFMASVGWMCENKINLSIMAKQLQVEALHVTEADAAVWSAVVVFVIPVTVFVLGFVVWYRRRRK